MHTVQGKSLYEWLDWLEIEGTPLAKEERDVRVFKDGDVSCFGSLKSVSSGEGTLTLLCYGPNMCNPDRDQAVISVRALEKIEVFDSRRLRTDRAYAQMNEMMALVHPDGC